MRSAWKPGDAGVCPGPPSRSPGEKAGEYIATESAKVAAASGENVDADLFMANKSAIATGVAKAIDLTQSIVEGYHQQPVPQVQPQAQPPR